MTYVVYFANAGVAATGLTCTWEYFRKVSDGADPGDSPAFTEVAGGWYKFTYDPTEDITAVVDGGAALADTDRYAPVYISQQDSRLDTRLSRIADDETGLTALRVEIKNKNVIISDDGGIEERIWDRINHDDTGLQSLRVEIKNRNAIVSTADFETRLWERLSHDDTGLSSIRIEIKNAESKLVRSLGLMQENFRMKDMTFDKNGNLLSGTINIYDTAADANNDVNEIATYTVAATYAGAKNLNTYVVTRG